MNRTSRVMSLMMAAALTGSACFAAEEAASPVAVTLDAAALTAYVWRGQVLNDEAVFQPGLTAAKNGFSLNAWGNFNMTDNVTADPDFSEIDLTLSYSGKAGSVGYSVGIIEYLFPHQSLAVDEETTIAYPGTREAFVTFNLPDLVVVPSLSVYYDFDEADDFYASAGVAYAPKLSDSLSMALSASVGYALSGFNSLYYGVDGSAFNDATAGISLTYAVNSTVSIVPGVQYVMLIDSEIEDAAGTLYKDDSQVIGSVKVTCVF